MITYEDFLKITLGLQKAQKINHTLYSEFKIDLMDFTEGWEEIVNVLLKNVFNERQMDWFGWWAYESEFSTNGLTATDENGNPICHSFKSTYEFLKTLEDEL